MRQGELEGRQLGAGVNAPAIRHYLDGLVGSPFTKGVLDDFIEVNPRMNTRELSPDLPVSFLPMEAVEDQGTGGFQLQLRVVEEVSKGYTAFAEGDIIWAKINPCMQNGKSTVATGLTNGLGFGSTEFHVLRPRTKQVLAEFAWYFLSFTEFLEVAKSSFTGSAGQQRVPAEFLRELPLPIPPLPIQRELVAAMNAARTLRQQQLAEAEELLGSFDEFVMTTVGMSVVAAKERPTFAIRQQDIGNRLDSFFHSPHFVPITQALAGTKTATIGQIANFSREIWRPETHSEPLFRYVEISGVNPRSGEATWQQTPTAEAPNRARMAVKPGDILVSLTRPHHGSIALLPANFPESVASTGFAVLRDFSPLVVPSYVWAALRTKLGLQQMMQRSSGGNYPAITEVELAKVQIPLPDLATQQAIADEVQRRRTAARALRETAETGWAAAKAAFESTLLNPA